MGNFNYAEQNRLAWNQVAPIHHRHSHTDLRVAFLNSEFSLLDDIEKSIFQRLEIQGKAIAQFCCNNGRELISANFKHLEKYQRIPMCYTLLAQKS